MFFSKQSKNKKFLLICWFDPNAYGTIVEHIGNIQKLSQYDIEVLNLFGKSRLRLPKFLRLSRFDGIIFHNTLSYNIDNVRNLDLGTWHNLKSYQGLKILMKQDECLRVNKTVSLLEDWGFDLLLTCVPPSEHAKVYPPSRLPKLKFLTTLTGYINEEMRALPYSQATRRHNDVVYRGMKLPYFFGALAMEKYEIGEKFKEFAGKYGLKIDISSRIEDRVFGDKWYEFLGTSKAVLAVESGASIFDFTGELELKTQEYLKAHPEATFEEVQKLFLLPHEGKVYYNQISPRHFEAAAAKTLQVMFEGEYSGIFKPGIHYVSLKKDYSNIDQVIKDIFNEDLRTSYTENAYRDIVLNNEYTYPHFVERFDRSIAELF